MINFDHNNINSINVQKIIKKHFKSVKNLHQKIIDKKGVGSEFTDWINYPTQFSEKEILKINNSVKRLKNKNKVKKLLVIGIGGSYLGALSGIHFVKGKSNEDVIFVGTDLSSSTYHNVLEKLKNKKWAICVISKSGTTLEPSLAFRFFKSKLKETLKPNEKISDYIIAITDHQRGVLKEISYKEGYESFVIPDGIGGRFSGITPVGLYPMAFAGVNIQNVLNGAKKAQDHFTKKQLLNDNEAYLYAVLRYYQFTNRKKTTELMVTWDSDLTSISKWYTQLATESEGKDGKGLFVTDALFTQDLHSIGQLIQDGPKSFFETILWVKKPPNDITINSDKENLDHLNLITKKSLNQINKIAYKSVLRAHSVDGKIDCVVIEIDDRSEESLGYLWYFFFMSITMSGYLLKINPFNQPGVEAYKAEMNKNLKK